MIGEFHRQIIADATAKLRRPLTIAEQKFVEQRGGFLALEMIQNIVATATPAEVERYLNGDFSE